MNDYMHELMMACYGGGVTPPPSPLPAGYTQYDWIKCNVWGDGSYIDTGVPNQASGVKVRMLVKNTVAGPNGNQFMGCSNWIHTLDIAGFNIRWVNKTDQYLLAPINVSIGQTYDIEAGDDYVTVNGVSGTAYPDGGNHLGGNIFFLRGIQYNCEIPIYSFKLWLYDVLTIDYIPSTDPNGVPGVYDLVSESFLSNAGSGSLVVGND